MPITPAAGHIAHTMLITKKDVRSFFHVTHHKQVVAVHIFRLRTGCPGAVGNQITNSQRCSTCQHHICQLEALACLLDALKMLPCVRAGVPLATTISPAESCLSQRSHFVRQGIQAPELEQAVKLKSRHLFKGLWPCVNFQLLWKRSNSPA